VYAPLIVHAMEAIRDYAQKWLKTLRQWSQSWLSRKANVAKTFTSDQITQLLNDYSHTIDGVKRLASRVIQNDSPLMSSLEQSLLALAQALQDEFVSSVVEWCLVDDGYVASYLMRLGHILEHSTSSPPTKTLSTSSSTTTTTTTTISREVVELHHVLQVVMSSCPPLAQPLAQAISEFVIEALGHEFQVTPQGAQQIYLDWSCCSSAAITNTRFMDWCKLWIMPQPMAESLQSALNTLLDSALEVDETALEQAESMLRAKQFEYLTVEDALRLLHSRTDLKKSSNKR